MNINQLHELLGRRIADGHGNDDVLVNLHSDDIDSRMQGVLDRHDWTVGEVRPRSFSDISVAILNVRPDVA
jgi:hypothetical protein